MNSEHVESDRLPNEHRHPAQSASVTDAPNLRYGLGKRLLLMVASFVGYSLAEVAAKLVLAAQILIVVITGRTNPWLLERGRRVSRYIYSAWNYLLFVNALPPWPLQRFVAGRPG